MRKHLYFFICSHALLFFFFASIVYSATYYIKNTGNDSSSGLSDSDAWKTIAKVNGFSFSDGDTVCLKRGDVFDDAILRNAKVDNFTIRDYGDGSKPRLNGDINKPIHIENAPINSLVIQNVDISGQDWYQSKNSNIYINGVNGVTIDGVIGDGHFGGNASDGKTAITISYCTGKIIVRNCNLYNWGPSVIPTAGTDIMGIAISHITSGSYQIYDNIVHNVNADCLHLYESTAPGTVYNNTFYNAGEDGIDVKGTSNCEIYGNEFYRTSSFTGGGGSGGYKTHIITHEGASPKSKGITIRNNTFHDGDAAAIVTGNAENISIYENTFRNCGGTVIVANNSMNVEAHHNIIINPQTAVGWGDMDAGGIYENNSSAGTKIYNNTIYNPTGTCKHPISIACSNAAQIFENIIYTAGSDPQIFALNYHSCGTEITVQNNCWFVKNNLNRTKFKGKSFLESQISEWRVNHPGAVFSDPLFTDPDANDFSLAAGSPCRLADRTLGAVQTPASSPPAAPSNFLRQLQ